MTEQHSKELCSLINAAIRDHNPVVGLEHELMYGTSFPMSDEAQSKDFVIPFGKAKFERTGSDVTIISFSKPVGICLEAAEILHRPSTRRAAQARTAHGPRRAKDCCQNGTETGQTETAAAT